MTGRVAMPAGRPIYLCANAQPRMARFVSLGPQSRGVPSGLLTQSPDDGVPGDYSRFASRPSTSAKVWDWRSGIQKSCTGCQKPCTGCKGGRIEFVRRKHCESCSRSRCEQFVADQRCSATSTWTQSSAGADARKRHLLHGRTPNARTLSRTISSNSGPRACGRDRCRGSRRHHAKGR